MLKAVAYDSEGKRVLVIGLTRLNVDNLVDGSPIDTSLAKFPKSHFDEIFIFFEETDELMKQKLIAKGLIPPDAPDIFGTLSS